MPRKRRSTVSYSSILKKGRERRRLERATETDEKREERRRRNREAQRFYRTQESAEETEARRKRQAHDARLKRVRKVLNSTPQEYLQHLERRRKQKKSSWDRQTPEEREAKKQRELERRRKKGQETKEDEEEMEIKRKKSRMFTIFSKFCPETKEEREERLARDREEKIKIRFEKIEEAKQKYLKEQQKPRWPKRQQRPKRKNAKCSYKHQLESFESDENESLSGEEEGRMREDLPLSNNQAEETSTIEPPPSPSTIDSLAEVKIKVEWEEEEGALHFEYAFGPPTDWEEEDKSLNFLDYDANQEDESYMKMREGESVEEWTERVRNHEREGHNHIQPPNHEGSDQLKGEEEEGGGSRAQEAPLRSSTRIKVKNNLNPMKLDGEYWLNPPPPATPSSSLPTLCVSKLSNVKLSSLSLRYETREERIKRLGQELERRKDYMSQVIAKKLGEEAVQKFHELISQPPQKKATFCHPPPSSEDPGREQKSRRKGRPRVKDLSVEEREEFIKKKKERLEALPKEVIEQRKAKAAANARTKIRMDKEEYRIHHVLTSLDPLQIFEDEKGMEALKYWVGYKSTKLPYEVWKWRVELYPMLIATPPENETEEEKFTRFEEIMNKIKSCVTLYGEKVKEYVTTQKNKMNTYAAESNKKKFKTGTPQEIVKNREKLNAYLREYYRRKKLKEGITIKVKGSQRAGKANSSNQTLETESNVSGCGVASEVDNEKSPVPLGHNSPQNNTNPMSQGASTPQPSYSTRETSNRIEENKEKSKFVLVSPAEKSSEFDEMMRDSGDEDYQDEEDENREGWTPIATFEIDQIIQKAALEHPQIIGESDSFINHLPLNGQEQMGQPDKHHSSLHQQTQIPPDNPPQLDSSPHNQSMPQSQNGKNAEINLISQREITSSPLISHESLITPSAQSKIIKEPSAKPQEKSANEATGTSGEVIEAEATAAFENVVSRGAHVLKVHGSPSPFACCVCCKGFSSTKELIHHIWMSHFESGCGLASSCPHCNKPFQTQKQLEMHIRKRHLDKVEKGVTGASPFFCFLCSTQMGGEVQLKSHMETVHKPTRASLYFCNFCGILIKFKDHLKQHISLFHQNECGDLTDPEEYGKKEEECCGIFTCDICDSRFVNEEYLKGHQMLVSHFPAEEEKEEGLKFECISCWKKFLSSELRDEHFLRDCSLTKVKCVKCGEKFTTQAILYQHVNDSHSHKSDANNSAQKHTLFFPAGHKGYKCELCSRSYENVQTLFSHFSRQHWDFVQKIILKKESPLQKESEAQKKKTQTINGESEIASCGPSPVPQSPISSRSFESVTSRYVHTCTLCETSFSGKTFHEIHTNYKKLCDKMCPVCSKRFTRSLSLLKHLREAHEFDECRLGVVEECLEGGGEGACPSAETLLHCTVCFSSLSAIQFHKEHLAVGLKSDPYVKTCTICGSKLVGSFSLLGHMRQFHSAHSSTSAETPPPPPPTLPNTITIFPCTICKSNYKNVSFLKTHFEWKHCDSSLKLEARGLCELCNKTFLHLDNLLIHKMEIHKAEKDPLECQPCHKLFISQQRLKDHRETLHFPSHFNTFCDVCGKQMRAEYIRRHVKFYHPNEAHKIVKSESRKLPVLKILEIILRIRDGREIPNNLIEDKTVNEEGRRKDDVELMEIDISLDEEEKQGPSAKRRKRLKSSKGKKRKGPSDQEKKMVISKNGKKNRKMSTLSEDNNSEEELALESEVSNSEDDNVLGRKKKEGIVVETPNIQKELKKNENLIKSLVLVENCDDLMSKQMMMKVSQPSSSPSPKYNLRNNRKSKATEPSISNRVVKTSGKLGSSSSSLSKATSPPQPSTAYTIKMNRKLNSTTCTKRPSSTSRGNEKEEGRDFLSWISQERIMTGNSSCSLESDGSSPMDASPPPIILQQLLKEEHFPLHDEDGPEMELDLALFGNSQNEEKEILTPLKDPLANIP